jgi:plastocyanin
MARQLLWILIAVVAGSALFSWWILTQNAPAPGASSITTPASPAAQTGLPPSTGTSANASVSTATAVTYDGSTFSPQNVTVAQGGTVTWTSTGGGMWVASDPSSLQNGYDGTTMEQHCALGYPGAAPFDECASGASYSFTFNKVGTWGYHDHLNEGAEGSVTVVAQ